jgi:hypothetical protein
VKPNLTGNTNDNAQVQANMEVVYNILNVTSEKVELAEAA